MVGKVLTQCQTTVGIQTRKHLNSAKEISIFASALYKVFSISFFPPVVHISVLVIVTSLVIKSVSHLVADNHTDGTIVECVISVHVEERILQNTCRKADFIGCRIIVGIYCLWIHVPVVTIHRLTYCMIDAPSVPELRALFHIFVIRFRWIYLQSAQICPLVRIAHFYIECIKLKQGIYLGRIVHPTLCGDTLTKCYLQILNQGKHTLLGSLREVLLGIDLTKSLAHHTLNLTCATLPQWMVLLTTSLLLAIEVKVLGYGLIV